MTYCERVIDVSACQACKSEGVPAYPHDMPALLDSHIDGPFSLKCGRCGFTAPYAPTIRMAAFLWDRIQGAIKKSGVSIDEFTKVPESYAGNAFKRIRIASDRVLDAD